MKNNKVSTILLLVLLFLRIPFLNIIKFIYYVPPVWAVEFFDVGTFVLIGILIWFNKDDLEKFHISKLSLWVFIFSGTLLRFTLSWTTLLFWGVSIFIFCRLRKGSFIAKTPGKDYLWAFRGLVLGIGLSIAFSIFSPSNLVASVDSKPRLFWGVGIFFYELSRAALPEEMVFRGFLWGYLKKFGFDERKILIIQAGLFWLAHLNYFEKKYTFWVIVPLMGIVMGLIVWRSRTLSSSILLHAVYNTMSYFL
jgi:membrane protease YdiL (CAAX protease family)